MVGITEASAAISGIKTAMDMLKGIHSLKSEADINSAVINIQRTLLDAQASALIDREKHMELLSRIEQLDKQISSGNKWDEERARYELKEFPTGAFAYVLCEGKANGEPPHKLCTKCFHEGKKSILQVKHKRSGGESVTCTNCNQTMTLSPFPPVQIDYGTSSWLAR